jgi:hypothetical protein
LSVYQEGAAPLLVSYRAPLPAAALQARYRKALIDGGFLVRDGTSRPGVPGFMLISRGAASALVLWLPEGASTSSALLVPLPAHATP